MSKLLQEGKELNRSRPNLVTGKDFQKLIKDTNTSCKEIIFGVNNPICIACLNELRKQQVINEIIYRKILLKAKVRKLDWDNVVVDREMMIDKSKGEVLGPGVDYKATYCKVEKLRDLNDIGTLDISSICHFLLKKSSLLFFLPCSSSSHGSFAIFLFFILASVLSLRYYLPLLIPYEIQ